MAREKLGVALFAGIVGLTGIVSSGKFVDANKWLEQFRDSNTPTVSEMDAETTKEVIEPKTTSEVMASEKTVNSDVDVVTQAEPKEAAEVETSVPEKSAEEALIEAQTDTAQTDAAKVLEDAAKDEPVQSAETVSPVMPTFDILRVEQDGSMLIAGLATPNSDVELVTGSKVLAKTTANTRGEFVAVLDKPLEQGDYEIVLRTTSADGSVMTSAETAIVSIPENGSTEVLALVEAPGAPSRLITNPLATPALVPVEPEAPEAPQQVATADPEVPIENAEPVVESTAEATPVPEKPQAEPQDGATEVPVRIEAVEIDGPTIFVAGAAEAGSRLRVYANGILLGDTIANAEGRFLVQVNRELLIGDYLIRADVLGKDGRTVLARAAVPFTRSEGEKLAAIAVPAPPVLPSTPPTVSAPDVDKPNIDEAEKIAPNTALEIETAALGERLAPAKESVIIRRGDTLWQISRRVYGRGVKFTTIYEANQEQIKDPNRIWPGQVFALPETESPDAN